jgi:hypothetical protein
VDLKSSADDTSGGYGEWLLRRRAWRPAHDHFLLQEYRAPSARNRLALGLTCLNTGEPDEAYQWVRGDSGAAAAAMASLAFYRSGRLEDARAAARTALNGPRGAVPTRAAAVVTLCSLLWSEDEDPAYERRSALRVLYSEDESDVQASSMDARGARPAAWPSAVASVVPGLGQTVNGYATDGLSALVACSLLGLATVSAADDGNTAGAACFGIMFGYAYTANILAGGAAPGRRWEDSGRVMERVFSVRFDPAGTLSPGDWLGEP